MDGRHQVAEAWSKGHSDSQGNVSTNGQDVYSYGHVVGHTSALGQKVAYCCHYSVTTAKHCSAFKGVADRVQPCADHTSSSCACCKTTKPGLTSIAS